MTDHPPRRRKRIRLDSQLYAHARTTWHITIDTANRRPLFIDSSVAERAISILRERCESAGASLLLYCVMPEHVHAVIQVGHGDLISIVRAVKSILGIWWNKNNPGQGGLWQRSFYDRGIRTEHDLEEVTAYVFQNPVDAGLAEDWSVYPWIGGSLIDDGM